MEDTQQDPHQAEGSTGRNDQYEEDGHPVIKDLQGSLFLAPVGAALAHCVSSDLKMGAGIAKQFANLWPNIRKGDGRSKEPGSVYVFQSDRGPVFNLITKKKYNNKPTMDTLMASLIAMKEEALSMEITSICVPELGSGLDRLDPEQVRKAINTVFDKSGISITMYHLSKEDRELVVETEKEERKQNKERKHVSFNLKKNQTNVIMTATIPGLVVTGDETKSSKKKKKKRKKIADVGEETEVVTPSVSEWDPKKKLEKLKKKLRQLEANEARLESVKDEAEIGKLQRGQRKKELEEEIHLLENRLALF